MYGSYYSYVQLGGGVWMFNNDDAVDWFDSQVLFA
jgi:hypothetical protein